MLVTMASAPVESRMSSRISTNGRLVEDHLMVYKVLVYQTLPQVGEYTL